MKEVILITIRVVVTLWLLHGAYKETGIYTGISLFLVWIGIEGLSYNTRKNGG